MNAADVLEAIAVPLFVVDLDGITIDETALRPGAVIPIPPERIRLLRPGTPPPAWARAWELLEDG
jgi:hypothetical protein